MDFSKARALKPKGAQQDPKLTFDLKHSKAPVPLPPDVTPEQIEANRKASLAFSQANRKANVLADRFLKTL